MASAAVEFTVVGVDRASETFDSVARSAEDSTRRISAAAQDAGSKFDTAGESAGELASWTATLGDGMATLGERIGGPAGGFLQFAGNGIMAATALGDIGEGLVRAVQWIGQLSIVQKAQAMVTGVVTAAQWAWNAAMNANPIGLIIVGIAALIGIVVLLVQNWDTVRAAGARAWEWIRGVWSSAAGWMNTNVVQPIGRFFSGLWDGVQRAWSGATSFFEGIGAGIKNAFRSAFNAVAGWWNRGPGSLSWSVPDWVPLIGGKTLSVPNIPLLAEGGNITRSGLAIVGERGPELLRLPTGAQVQPLSGPNAAQSKMELHLHVQRASITEVRAAAEHLRGLAWAGAQ